MAERTVWFLGAVVMVEAIRKVVAWSRRRRRSGATWFPSVAVKARWMARFLGAVMAWRRSGWRRHGLGCVEEGTANFGSVMVSELKSSD
jgi:hypothetical protein